VDVWVKSKGQYKLTYFLITVTLQQLATFALMIINYATMWDDFSRSSLTLVLLTSNTKQLSLKFCRTHSITVFVAKSPRALTHICSQLFIALSLCECSIRSQCEPLQMPNHDLILQTTAAKLSSWQTNRAQACS
jgi:hypothetical protein